MCFRLSFSVIVILFCSSCSVAPEDIAYNKDSCHECKMIISDHHFGSEVVTKKGRIYKFDSVECLVDNINNNQSTELAHVLVTDYLDPGNLVAANTAYYLISKNLPSPMGEYISAFADVSGANKMQSHKEGKIFNWNELIAKYQ